MYLDRHSNSLKGSVGLSVSSMSLRDSGQPKISLQPLSLYQILCRRFTFCACLKSIGEISNGLAPPCPSFLFVHNHSVRKSWQSRPSSIFNKWVSPEC